MAHQVVWTKIVLDTFIEEANLSDIEEKIIRSRAKGWTISKQAYEFGMSESNVKRIIAILKKKYDVTQKYSKILPKRTSSKTEDYLDSH